MSLLKAKDYTTEWLLDRFLNWALSNAVLIATAVIASGMGVLNWKYIQDNFLFFYIFSILVIVPSSFYVWKKIQEIKEKRKIKYAFSERHIFHCINEDGTITHTRTGKLTILKNFLTHYREVFFWTGEKDSILGIEYEINGEKKTYPLDKIYYNNLNYSNFINLPFKLDSSEVRKGEELKIKTIFKLSDKEKRAKSFINSHINYPLEKLTLSVKLPRSEKKKVIFEEYLKSDTYNEKNTLPTPITKERLPIIGGLAMKTIKSPELGHLYKLEWK